MEASIIAGRFAPFAGASVVDLATAERVRLHVEPVPHESGAQSSWSEACAALCGVWHGSLADCVDFGPLGTSQRFTAFRAVRQVSTVGVASWPRARRVVDAFLATCGIPATSGGVPYADIEDRLVVLPTLHDTNAIGSSRPRLPRDPWFGLRLVARAALHIMTEHLSAGPQPGTTIHRVGAAPGCGGRTFLRHLARSARQLGYLPLGTRALDWILDRKSGLGEDWAPVLSRHYLVLLHDGRQRGLETRHDLLGALLHLVSRDPKPLVIVELTPVSAVDLPLQLGPLTERELEDMVVSHGTTTGQRRRIARAARACQGRPGLFVQRLGKIFSTAPDRKPAANFTVHEARAPYLASGLNDRSARAFERQPIEPGSFRPADVAVSAASQAAVVLCARGRHAQATRTLKQAEAAAVRRGLWSVAVEAAIRRGGIAAARGRTADAEEALLTALDHGERSASVKHGVICAIHLGTLRLQDARIDGAESTLRSAVATAKLLPAPPLAAWGTTQLALCLWWQDRNDEARHVLEGAAAHAWRPDPAGAPAPHGPLDARAVQVSQACTAARVSLALGDIAAARARLDEAGHLAVAGDAGLQGMVYRAEARWRAAAGDAPGFQSSVETAVSLAVRSRHPLDRLRAMVGHVEGCSLLGLPNDAARLRRLERAGRHRLPGLLALRLRVAVALWRRTPSPAQLAAECRTLRLHALCRTWRLSADSEPPLPPRSAMFDDVIEVLRICQDEDASDALRAVLELVRRRTHATALQFVSGGRLVVAAVPSGAGPAAVAVRALDSGLALDPSVTERGLEAAVVLRFGGRLVGALAGRWSTPPPVETARLMGFLTAVATAAAPCLGAAVDALEPPSSRPALEMDLLGESAAMQQIRHAVVRAANAPFPVLIQGESGCGKELVARAVHGASARRGRPMCALNCAALPDDLLEAELFGHARGAFTGASSERAGLFEDADGGVLFLDEVGELTARAQAKLLRVIQEGEIRRIGETFARRVDVRIVAATNRPLDQEIAAGRFRRDLRYRLDVIRIVVPPLRDRPDDIPALARHFWRSATERVGSRAVLSAQTLAALARYDWPGNVRELQNVLASLAVSAPIRGIVCPSALPAMVGSAAARSAGSTLESARRIFEERYVRAALARAGGHRGRAAAELGLTRQGLAKLMGRLGLAVAGGEPATGAEGRCAS